MELGLIKLIARGAEMNEVYEWLERSKNKDSVYHSICIEGERARGDSAVASVRVHVLHQVLLMGKL